MEGVDFFDVVLADEEREPESGVADAPVPTCFQLDVHGIGVRVPMGFQADELRRLLDVLC